MDFNQINDLECIECHLEFNRTDHAPHMLPTCGHSICRKCLDSKISSQETFICNEDEIPCTYKELKMFPLNQSIYKLLSKRRSTERPRTNTVILEVTHFQQEDDEQAAPTLVKSKSSQKFDQAIQEVQEESKEVIQLCKKHAKKLELVCLDDCSEICVQCALFGAHKSHNYIPQEEAIKLLSSKVQQAILILDGVQKKQDHFNLLQNEPEIVKFFTNKFQIQSTTIKNHFLSLSALLEAREKEILAQLDQKILLQQNQFTIQFQRIFVNVNEKVNQWKSKAREKLALYNQNDIKQLGLLKSDTLFPDGVKIEEELEKAIQKVDNQNGSLATNSFTLQIPKEIKDAIQSKIILVEEGQLIHQQQQQSQYPEKKLDSLQVDHIQLSQQHRPSQQQSEPYIEFNKMIISEEDNSKDVLLLSDFQEQGESLMLQQHCQSSQIEYSDSAKSPICSTSESSQMGKKSKTFTPQDFDLQSLQSHKSVKSKRVLNKAHRLKFEQLMLQIGGDKNDLIDMTQLELNDEDCYQLSEVIQHSTAVKVLKLSKNKIGDEGAIKLFSSLEQTIIQTIHLQQNCITERSLDGLVGVLRNNKKLALKSVYLNTNQIQSTKCKKKIEEIKKMGVAIQI